MSHTVAEPKSRTLAIIAMIVAGASLLLYWNSFPDYIYFALILGPVGVALGLVAWLRARKGKAEGRGLALAAVIVSMLSFGVLATHFFLFSVLFSAFG